MILKTGEIIKLKLIAKNFNGFLLATAIFTTILMLNRSNAMQSVELEGRWILTELRANGNEIDVNSADSDLQTASITFDNNKRYLPDRRASLLVGFILQNRCILSKNKRQKDFAELTDSEIEKIETAIQEIANE